MEKIKDFVYNNPVRVAAFVSSAVALFVSLFVPGIPVEPAIAFVLSAMGLSEFAQRKENEKTMDALFTEIPEE